MLKLKLQYFGHLMRRTDSLEKTLMLGNIEGRRRRGQQRMRWLDGITDLMDMSLSKFWGVGDGQGSMACCIPWGHKELDTAEWLNWTELNWTEISFQVWNSPYSLNFAWNTGWGDKFESLTSCLHASWLHNKVLFFLKSQCLCIGFCACQAANSWCLTVFINLVWSLFHNVYPLKL